jgi:hypothetical protein
MIYSPPSWPALRRVDGRVGAGHHGNHKFGHGGNSESGHDGNGEPGRDGMAR